MLDGPIRFHWICSHLGINDGFTLNFCKGRFKKMAQMFFMDESGHDHKTMPYEVRGGFSIHMSKLWSLVQDIRALELHCFGQRLIEFKGRNFLARRSLNGLPRIMTFLTADGGILSGGSLKKRIRPKVISIPHTAKPV